MIRIHCGGGSPEPHRSTNNRDVLMEEVVLVRPKGCDFSLEVPTRNRSWYEGPGYEPFSTRLFERSCRAADIVLDIGAHVGYFSLVGARSMPTARVISVEASPDNFEVLNRNLMTNAASQVEVINAAFGASAGRTWIELTECSDNCGISGHPNSPTIERVEVPAISGSELRVPPGSRLAVKLDVEGHELEALEGLASVFDAAQDARLLIEFNPKCIRAAGSPPLAVLDWLYDHGFRLFALDEDAYRWTDLPRGRNDVEVMAGTSYFNILCIPSTKALTISVVMHSAALAGAERSHLEMVQELVSGGCMVDTVMPSPDGGLVEQVRASGSSASLVEAYAWWVVPDNDPDAEAATARWRRHMVAPQVTDAIAAIDPDVVLTQTIAVPQGAIASAILGKPHVWWLREYADIDHGLRLPMPPAEMGRVVSELSAVVLANSAAVRDHYFPCDHDAALVVHPGPRLTEVIRRTCDGARPYTFGVIAGLHLGKGQADAIAAIAELKRSGLDARLLCVGPGSAADIARLEAQIEDLDVGDRVSLAGMMDDRNQIYSLVDAVAVTSRAEAFGRIAFEATDAGVPVIYAANGGIVEYMIPGVTGLAYPPGDCTALAQAMASLIGHPERTRALVASASHHLRDFRNNPERTAALLEALHRAVHEGSRKPWQQLVAWLAGSIGVAVEDGAQGDQTE